MKVKTNIFILFAFIAFHMLEMHFYDILYLNNTYVKYVLFAVTIVAYFFSLILESRKYCRVLSPLSSRIYIWLIIPLFLIVQYIYTKNTYGQSVVDFFKTSYHYLFIVLYFYLFYVFTYRSDRQNTGVVKSLDIVTTVVSVGLAVNIINTIVYNLTKYSFLNISIREREGALRTYGLSSLLGFIVIYTVWRYFKISKNYKYLVQMIISIIAVVYCSRSRYLEITIVMVSAVIFISGSNFNLKKIKRVLLVLVVLSVFIALGGFDMILDSFSLTGNYSGSSNSRLREMDYYLNAFSNHQLFGLGLLSTETSIGNYMIRGPLGNNFPTDVGYFGALGNMGFSHVLVYGFTKIRKVRVLSEPFYSLSVGLLVYVLVTSITQILTDPARILQLPVILAVSDATVYNIAGYTKK